MKRIDVCIAGAGLIGAALALECTRRGLRVTLLSEGEPLAQASSAAAGMLATDDPDNPPALHALAQLSRDLYPAFLDHLHQLGGVRVHAQTHQTLQALAPTHPSAPSSLSPSALRTLLPQLDAGPNRFALLEEQSLDPRELAYAARRALTTSSIDLRTHARVLSATELPHSVHITTAAGRFDADRFVDCTGAWTLPPLRTSPLFTNTALPPVVPRKGQMLSLTLPPSLPLRLTVRTHALYIVPRTHGAQAGRAIVGATVEDRGFDTTVDPAAIRALHRGATALLPAIADAVHVEAWAGLRPATADGLPLLGATGARSFVSKGHFRNGILLAPASAVVLAQLLLQEPQSVALEMFSPARLASKPQPA